MLLVRVPGPPRVHGVVRWPKCPEPVQWGRWVVLDRVVVVLRVCSLCVVPGAGGYGGKGWWWW